MKLDTLVATMNQNDCSLAEKMNLKGEVIVANQCQISEDIVYETSSAYVRMISTKTRGVGVNRNIAILASDADVILFSDDDCVYNDDYVDRVLYAYEKHPDADVIIFGMNLLKNGKVYKTIKNKDKRIHLWDGLKYGAYVISVRRNSLLKNGIFYSTLYGGGCKYNAGEDSLLLVNCFKKHMRVYTDSYILGNNNDDVSSWRTGFNEKYFYDKGVWIANAFPKLKWLMKIYFVYNLRNKSDFTLKKKYELLGEGIKGFKKMQSYQEFRNTTKL